MGTGTGCEVYIGLHSLLYDIRFRLMDIETLKTILNYKISLHSYGILEGDTLLNKVTKLKQFWEQVPATIGLTMSIKQFNSLTRF